MTTPALDAFQQDTLSFLDHAHGRAVIADPMGARKTGTVLAWLAHRTVQHTLVVAPSAVHGHWAREAGKFFPWAEAFTGRVSKQRRTDALDDAIATEPSIYITTYESMKQDQHALQNAGFDAVVFDEGHRLQGRRTDVALCANAVTKKPQFLIIATGTPVLNHAAELWQYLHMLAPKVYTAFWTWAEEHYRVEVKYYKSNRFPTRIIHDFREDHEEIVRAQIAPYFIQRDIADLFPGQAWVEEPEHVEIEVELSPAERKLYANLVKHKWAIAGDTEVTTKNALDLTTRLTQITSDWGSLDATVDDGTKVKATVELALDLVEREEQVVIFAKYKATVYRIVQAIQAKSRSTVQVLPYTGDQDAKTRDYSVYAGFMNGQTQVLVGTLDSLSEGVDGLQHAASNIIMVDRHWTPAKNDQAIGRLRRSGQLKRVTVYHVFAKDTIDATITSACLRKTNVVESLKGRPLVDAIYGRI